MISQWVPLGYLPNGVSQWDSSPIDVYFCRVNIQHLDVGQNDHAEGLVDLPHGNVILLQPCCIQSLTDAQGGSLNELRGGGHTSVHRL